MSNGVGDPGDCDNGQACYAGVCKKANGAACTANTECGSGQCECANFGCTSRVCTASSCTCKYGAAGACSNNLGDGSEDPEDCSGDYACFSGSCKLKNGTACSADSSCQSGQCECTNAACTSRVCAAASCTCKYGTNGACTTALTTGTQDPGDCASGNACYGGICTLALGSPCTSNAACGSGQCECADATCSARVCATANCVCKYGSAGSCTSNLSRQTVDPEDCVSPNACGGGSCLLGNGLPCNDDANCASGQCECADPYCALKFCVSSSCTCSYGAGGACTTALPRGTVEADCSATGYACCGDGTCNKVNGEPCGGDSDCCSGMICFLRPDLSKRCMAF